jgi:hypothetical protein
LGPHQGIPVGRFSGTSAAQEVRATRIPYSGDLMLPLSPCARQSTGRALTFGKWGILDRTSPCLMWPLGWGCHVQIAHLLRILTSASRSVESWRASICAISRGLIQLVGLSLASVTRRERKALGGHLQVGKPVDEIILWHLWNTNTRTSKYGLCNLPVGTCGKWLSTYEGVSVPPFDRFVPLGRNREMKITIPRLSYPISAFP